MKHEKLKPKLKVSKWQKETESSHLQAKKEKEARKKAEQKSERQNRKKQKGATKSRWMMMTWVRIRLMGPG